MESQKRSFTKSEFSLQTDAYKRIFDIVRLLDEDNFSSEGAAFVDCEQRCHCYDIWRQNRPCSVCISSKAFASKRQVSKFEVFEGNEYYVIADYVEVDGKPHVLELVKKIDPSSFVHAEQTNSLLPETKEVFDKTYKDVLTGAYNRRYYEEKLKDARINAGIAMIDLDDLKIYNDLYGHGAGDTALQVVAKELLEHIRSTDRLIRYGGDEFLLIMENTGAESFENRLRVVMDKLNHTEVPGYVAINLSVSIGAVSCENSVVEEAVSEADKLMYRAKKEKNAIVTDTDEPTENKTKPLVLIADDSEVNRNVLKAILHNEYQVIEASGGKQCIAKIKKYGSDLSVVLLDLVMPDLDGFGVLRYMSSNHLIEDVPVITISGDESDTSVRKAYDMGVSDYINRPFDAKVVYRRVSNTINLYAKQRRLISTVSAEIVEKEKDSRILINILNEIVSLHNGKSDQHVTNVNTLTEKMLNRLLQLTDEYKLSNHDVFLIATASSLHDIGKLAIDDKILNKPGKLTPEEFEIVKQHTVLGADMVRNIKRYADEPLVRYIWEICMWHHERFDGKGYPDGLVGDEIPIAAQVSSIVDVYDALTSERVYKSAYSSQTALDMIRRGECGMFNPILVQCLFDIVGKLD